MSGDGRCEECNTLMSENAVRNSLTDYNRVLCFEHQVQMDYFINKASVEEQNRPVQSTKEDVKFVSAEELVKD